MPLWHREEASPGSGEDEEIVGSEEDSPDPGDNKAKSKEDLLSLIWLTLKKIKTPVSFAFSAVNALLPNPGLQLLDGRVIGLPLSPDDAQKIISLARPSPFGKGEETLVDDSVRRCWELNPTQFSLKNPEWSKAMKVMLDTVSSGLGILKGTWKISAELNKLLLYSPGAFFKAHRDTEKKSGMFATLIVCLPSPHEGGKLVLTHDNEKYEFETAKASSFNSSYVAFYADIQHEVLPVTSGYRLVLTFNLIRQTDFVVPAYNLARGQVQQLSTLLQRYNMESEDEDSELPPILVHKLKHKYTQGNLQFNLLKPKDLIQVQTLAELSTKLGFDIYLATLELTVEKDEECDDYEEKSLRLKNMVELDGSLVAKSLDCPDDALIDPTPQDEGEADEEDYQGYTGNEGCPVTFWYRDTVVIIVPPSQQLNFVFQFSSEGKIIESLFSKLMKKFCEDPAQKPRLEKLCELALKQKSTRLYLNNTIDEYSKKTPPFFKQAAATALDLGLFEIFDEASKRTNDKILLMLDIPEKLGRWAAKNGLSAMKDRLIKGVYIAPSVAKKVKFLQSVTNGFEASLQDLGSANRADLKQWSDEALFLAISQLKKLTKADGISLGKLHKTVDWSLFKSKSMPIIGKAETIVKIAFTNEFMSTLQHELNQEQRSFIESIIHTIWKDFVFDSTLREIAANNASSAENVIKDEVTANDLHHILENTITVLPPEYLETTVIPAILMAIPNASKECSNKLFIELVCMILKSELAGFRLSTADSCPSTLHKRLVQALLTKFLLNKVGLEPTLPTNWALPPSRCNCTDCAVINKFLQDPVKKSFDFPVAERRRRHLYYTFTNQSWRDWGVTDGLDYDVETIRRGSPYCWKITKHRRRYETEKSEWLKNTETAIKSLAKLKNDEPVNGKLEMYLQPYYNIIMKASVKELPDLKCLITTQGASNNASPAHNPRIDQADEVGLKRSADAMDLQNDETAKRTRE